MAWACVSSRDAPRLRGGKVAATKLARLAPRQQRERRGGQPPEGVGEYRPEIGVGAERVDADVARVYEARVRRLLEPVGFHAFTHSFAGVRWTMANETLRVGGGRTGDPKTRGSSQVISYLR